MNIGSYLGSNTICLSLVGTTKILRGENFFFKIKNLKEKKIPILILIRDGWMMGQMDEMMLHIPTSCTICNVHGGGGFWVLFGRY
jgi:hypothetical protein